MIANCWKCKAPFRFDEAKVHPRAIVRCPSCQSRNLLEQDPNTPEPHFFVSPAEAVPKPLTPPSMPETLLAPPEPGREPAQDPLKNEPPAAPRPTPRGIRPPGEGITLRESDSVPSLEIERTPRRPAPPVTSLPLQRDPRAPQPAPASRPAPARRYPGEEPKHHGGWWLLLAGVVILVAGLALWFSPLHKKEAPTNPETEAARMRGQAALAELKKHAPPPSGDTLVLAKEAESAYRQDLPAAYARAAKLFAQAVTQDSENPELIARYVESRVMSEGTALTIPDVRLAADLIDYSLLANPDYAALHRAKARLLLTTGQEDGAAAEAELARKLEPSQAENLAVWGETLITKNPARAAGVLADVVDGGKGPLLAFRPLAEAYVATGAYAKAEVTLKLRDKVDSQSGALGETLGRLYEDLGLWAKAREVYEHLQTIRHDSPAGELGLARVDYATGNDPRVALKRLELPPSRMNGFSAADQGAVFNARSRYALLLGDFTLALMSAKRADELDARPVSTRYHYALALLHSGTLERETIESLLSSLGVDAPKDPDVLMLRGLYARLSGDMSAALGFFKESVTQDPAYTPGLLMLALMALEAPNVKLAFEYIQKRLTYAPTYEDDHPAGDRTTRVFRYEEDLIKKLEALSESDVDQDLKFQALGLVQSVRGAYDESVAAFAHVLANQPGHPVANVYSSYAAYKRRRPEKARKFLARALEHRRFDPAANELLVRLLMDEGKRAEARKLAERVVETVHHEARLLALDSLLAREAKEEEDARTLAGLAVSADPTSRLAKQARFFADQP